MADDRDRLILQLRRELDALQQNEKDYADLNFLLTNLEHRYNLLYEDKQRVEQEFMIRQETNLQTIALHRQDIDQMKEELLLEKSSVIKLSQQLEEKVYENQEYVAEINHLQNYAHQQNFQLNQDQANLLLELQTLKSENNILNSKIAYFQSKDSYMQERGQNQLRLDKLQESDDLRKQKEQLIQDKRVIQSKSDRFEQLNQQMEEELKQIIGQMNQLQNMNQNLLREVNESRMNCDELQEQKSINMQIMQNNEHFQQKIESLMRQNENERRPTPHNQVELDINRSHLQEALRENLNIKKQLLEIQQMVEELRNEKKALQQSLQQMEELSKQYSQMNTENERKVKEKMEQRILELERENDSLSQDLGQKKHEFEKLLKQAQQQLDISNSNNLQFSALEQDHQNLMKRHQHEQQRNREFQVQMELRDRELSRMVQRIQELENELKKKIKASEEAHEELDFLKVEREQTQQQLRRYYEESKVIKEYLQRKKKLNRLRNEGEFE